MKRKYILIFSIQIIALIAITNYTAIAQSFVKTYDFASVTTASGTTDPTPVPTQTGLTFGSFSVFGSTGSNSSAGGRFSFNDWALDATAGTLTGSINLAKYYEVKITPTAGYTLNLDSLRIKLQRSGTGVRSCAVRSSLDGYASNIPAIISPANTELTVVGGNEIQWVNDGVTTGQNGAKIVFPASYDNITTELTLRFYGWNAEGAGGTFSIDDVTVVGSLTLGSVVSVASITVTGEGNATTISSNGGTLQMYAAILPLDATDQTVTWSVINGTGQANMSTGGLLTAVANGTVTAKATANDGSGVFGELEITISNQISTILVSSITVTGTGGETTITTNGGTLQMLADILPLDATDQTVTWSVINGTGTANIDIDGLLTALTNGDVTVRATANDASGVFGEMVVNISNQIVITDLLYEGFDYTIGDTLPQHDWTGANSGDQIFVTTGNLDYSLLQASVGNKVSFNGLGRDFFKTFTNQNTGKVYFSFIMDVTSLGSLDAGGGYFTGFAANNTTYGATVWTKLSGSDYTIGINPRTGAGNTVSSSPIAINNNVFVVIAYEFVSGTGNDVVSIWINPTDLGGTAPTATLTATNSGGTDLTGIDRIFIRQDSDVETPFIDMDEIRVGLSWADVTPAGSLVMVSSITVSGAGGATTISTNGGTLQMLADILPVNATDQTVTWSVINGTGTVNIDADGLLSALTNGDVTVRATANDGSGVYGEVTITISNQSSTVLVSSITVTGTGGETTISTNGGTLQMLADILPIDATDQTVTWSVINGTGTANIDAAGLLSALTNGDVTVRATANDGSGVYGEATITISNQSSTILVSSITVTGTGGETTISTNGGTLQMLADVLPMDATDQTVTWSVINGTGSANIDINGLLTALTNGDVTVRATANDASGVYGELVVNISNQTVITDLLYEGFDYTIGDTLPQHDWTGANSGDQIFVTSGNLNYNLLQASVGNKVSFNGSGRDFFKTFTAQNTGKVYYSFIMDVTSLGSLDATGGYFTGLASNNTTFGASVWTKLSGTDYTIGINPRTVAGNTVSSSPMAINNDVFVVVSYEFVSGTSNDIVSIWINPTDLGGTAPLATLTATNTGGTDLTSIDRIFLRQDSDVETPFLDMDEIRVGLSWADVTPTSSIVMVSSIIVSGAGGETAITTNGGTLQMLADILPMDATDQTITWSVISGTGTANIDTDGLLTALTDGDVTVRATANDGSGVFGEANILISNQVATINYSNEYQSVKIYPNPSNGLVNIESKLTINYEAKIYDQLGELVYLIALDKSSTSINLSFLPKGVYLVQVFDKKTGQQSLEKIQIQ